MEYLLERELVQPEGGEVCFRARDMTTGSRVRLALWPSAPDEVIARGHARARVLESLDEPSIERLLQFGATVDTGATPAAPFVATEWVEGESLAERLPRGGVGFEEGIRIGTAIARGLERAHARGLVHGRIGPSTIVLASAPSGEDPRPRLVGFVSATLGPGGFASPERASAPPDALDPSLDVYSLGAVVFRCVSGRAPFENRDPKATVPMDSVRPVSLASLAPLAPDALTKLVDEMVSMDPTARPPMADVAARLEVLRPRPGSLPPRSARVDATMIARQSSAPSSRARGAPRSSAAIVTVAIAFGALGVAGGIALIALRSTSRTEPVASATGSSEPSSEASAAPAPTSSAQPSSTARLMTSVPIVTSSAPPVRFACGMSFFCNAEKQYCLVAGDRETTFSCVKAVRCKGRPECDCATVPGDTCERIEGGLVVRRSVGAKPGEEEAETDDGE